ncbi:unnamed protein product [Symbiodinium microadriaticum]|nr:unnamed protein product [Symbiodinium microadriaticum]
MDSALMRVMDSSNRVAEEYRKEGVFFKQYIGAETPEPHKQLVGDAMTGVPDPAIPQPHAIYVGYNERRHRTKLVDPHKQYDVAEYIVRHSPCNVVVVKDVPEASLPDPDEDRDVVLKVQSLVMPETRRSGISNLEQTRKGRDALTLAPESGSVAGVTRDSNPQAEAYSVTEEQSTDITWVAEEYRGIFKDSKSRKVLTPEAYSRSTDLGLRAVCMVHCSQGRLLQVCLLWEGFLAAVGMLDEIGAGRERVIHPSEQFFALMDCTDDADADRRLMREVLRHTGLLASEYPEAELRDCSRRIYHNWAGLAAEQLSFAEVHLLIYPRGFWHEEPVQMHLLQELWKQVGLDEAQQDLAMHVLQSEDAQKELHSRTRDFCVVPYLAAMVLLIQSDPENRQEYLEHLCSLMGVPSRLHWGLMLILSSLHFADELAELLVSAKEAHGAGSCAVGFRSTQPELPWMSGTALEASNAEPTQLRVVLWSGHIFAFDGLLASLEAAEKKGMAAEAVILSYAVAGRWGAARQQCEQLQESLGLGSALCLGSAADVLMDWCTSMGIGTETGCSIHDVRQTLQKLRHEVPTLRTADLLLCGYPYALCPILGTSSELKDVPMLVLVHGAGSLAEYADESITPWLLGTFKRWITSDPAEPTKGATAMALRKVVFNDRLDLALTKAAFGEASQPQLVEFGARYVLRLAGGVQCDRRLGGINAYCFGGHSPRSRRW